MDIAERGNRASIDKDQVLTWLDSKKPNSVLYVCFDSLCYFSKSQLLEIGLGLESSKALFIWVIRNSYKDGFLPEGFDERVRDRALVIKGWAPQFYNENFALNRLDIGAGIGVKTGLAWGEEENIGVLVTRDRVEEVVTRLMGESEAVQGMESGE
ncbi:hypothetical protein CMV_020199 [Castanea mollissima]|uniref:Uncharacterized protein n=1 Tax=Castanea mollissima TaxID=60419 RepID=A0A8J4VMY4_9ROSI|nr:hypothetical protein CMV_020199 [Castanea mollissima]